MFNQSSLETTIAAALQTIQAAQLATGGFKSETKIYENGQLARTEFRETVFYPAIISLALQHTDEHTGESIASSIREKINQFLLSQIRPEFCFTYWANDSDRTLPIYPPDLDDTMLAVNALQEYDPYFLSGTRLAQLTTHLLRCETTPGGPYRTWITAHREGGAWQEVDVVVNTNIYHTLKKSHISLPTLEKFCYDAIQNRHFHSPYYVGVWPSMYALTKLEITDPKLITSLINYIQAQTKSLYDPLACALAASSLIRLHAAPHIIEPLVALLLHTPALFPSSNYIMERHRSEETELSGASAWTAAAIIETLSLYQKYREQQPTKATGTYFKIGLYDTIVLKATRRLSNLPAPLYEEALSALARTVANDRHQEIGLLASYSNQYLSQTVSPRILQRLGFANLLGWLAYSLYDECFDEGKITSRLAVANIALREVAASYQLLTSNNRQLQQWTRQILDRVDVAHGLELEYGRLHIHSGQVELNSLKNHTQLPHPSERSLAHMLGAGYVFETMHPTDLTAVLRQLENFFQNYLATKQLCDDMHDWYDDLLRGHLTSVTLPLWTEWRSRTDVKITSIHLLEVTPTLHTLFWKKILPNTIAQAEKYVDAAQTACIVLPWQREPVYFHEALARLQTSLRVCREEYQKTQEFLDSYAKNFYFTKKCTVTPATKAERRNYLRHAAAMVAHKFTPPIPTRALLGES